jgi:hypothetical protein
MPKSRKDYEVEQWHQAAIKRALPHMPFTHPKQKVALLHHEDAYKLLFERYAAMPRWERFVYLIDEEFKKRIEDYAAKQEDITKKTGDYTSSFLVLRNAEYWNDIISMAGYFNRLIKERAMRLLKSYLRASRVRDVFGMALVGRALLELGVSSANRQRDIVPYLEDIFDRLNRHENPLSVVFEMAGKIPIEKAIVDGIWGTRLYTGTLGDGDRIKGKKETSIWNGIDIPEDNVSARNILGDIRGRAKRMEDGLGVFDYRVYEVLCDIAHPAGLGNSLLIDESEKEQGQFTVTLTKEKNNTELEDQIVAAATWGAYHGIGLILESSERFEKVEPTLRAWANDQLANEKFRVQCDPDNLVH